MFGDAHVLEQAARGALRAQPRQDAELKTADDCALTVFRDHELDVRVAIDRLEGLEIGLRQWIFETLSRTAERIVRQHRNNDADIITARATNGDL
jgi:hypothetical protein